MLPASATDHQDIRLLHVQKEITLRDETFTCLSCIGIFANFLTQVLKILKLMLHVLLPTVSDLMFGLFVIITKILWAAPTTRTTRKHTNERKMTVVHLLWRGEGEEKREESEERSSFVCFCLILRFHTRFNLIWQSPSPLSSSFIIFAIWMMYYKLIININIHLQCRVHVQLIDLSLH